jgi:hypothetical protein
MKLSERDKLLAMVLPALLVLIVYGVFLMPRKLTERTMVAKTAAAARESAPRPEQLAERQAALGRLARDNELLRAHVDSLNKSWQVAACNCASPARRNERMEKLSALLKRHGLSFVDDDLAVDTGKERLAAFLVPLAQDITQGAANLKPQVRRLRFQGRFHDVLDALEELSRGEILAIPVGLTMKTIPHPDRREWLLLVWI